MTLHANKFQYIALCRMERTVGGKADKVSKHTDRHAQDNHHFFGKFTLNRDNTGEIVAVIDCPTH